VKDLSKLSDDALMVEWEKHSQAALDAKARAKECSQEVTRRRVEAADPEQSAQVMHAASATGEESG
jgi:hypothetical protein